MKEICKQSMCWFFLTKVEEDEPTGPHSSQPYPTQTPKGSFFFTLSELYRLPSPPALTIGSLRVYCSLSANELRKSMCAWIKDQFPSRQITRRAQSCRSERITVDAVLARVRTKGYKTEPNVLWYNLRKLKPLKPNILFSSFKFLCPENFRFVLSCEEMFLGISWNDDEILNYVIYKPVIF